MTRAASPHLCDPDQPESPVASCGLTVVERDKLLRQVAAGRPSEWAERRLSHERQPAYRVAL